MMWGANGKRLTLLFVAIASYDLGLANGLHDPGRGPDQGQKTQSVSNSIHNKPSTSSNSGIKGVITQQQQTQVFKDEQQEIKDESQSPEKSKQPVGQLYDDQKPQAASKSVQQTQPLTTQATAPPKQQTKQQDGGSIPQHDKSKTPVAQMYDDQKPQAASKSVQQTQPSLTTQATAPPKQQTKQQDGGSIPQHAKSKTPVAQIYDDQKPQAASKSVQQTQPSLTTQATDPPKQQTKQQDGGSVPQHAKSKTPVAQMYDDQKPQAASKSVQQTQPSLTTQATAPPKQQTKQHSLTAGHKSKQQQKRQLYSLS
ncbi:uncharacterized protein LOC134464487 isoform X2 [Engraulis encrasicolus]|uniref:uncharacterized protein LOC134464487 isoform X2 n=1 Tax=Engraulis encrasicolus TaxID=184585 RepID=UPI002FD5C819